jgi:hypothetical protein
MAPVLAEEVHLRPAHNWLFEFGDAGDGTSCEKEFQLPPKKWVVYKVCASPTAIVH